MVTILHLETATTNCSVALSHKGKTIALKENDTPNYSHSEQLHVFIEEVLRDASMAIQEVDAIAVSKGPGSYTGLRIGVSAAKGLCFSLDIPLIAIETLKSLASKVKPSTYDYIIPVLDARRMEVYSKVFDGHLNEVRETKAEIIDESSFSTFASSGKTLLIGSGADKCKEVLKHPNFEFQTKKVPSALEMVGLAYQKYLEKDFEDVAYFEPYYLKDFILQTQKKG
jgi:tRNA threonylcarbamoyladenosine biosynthesis protein TsaB